MGHLHVVPFTQSCLSIFMIMIMILLTDKNLVITIAAYSQYDEQQFAMEPQDQVAVVGARVILPCRVINKQGVLQWTKDDFGLGTRRKLLGFERYSMIGSDEEGDYSLQIYPVTLDDNAEFQCQVSPAPNGNPGVRSRYATLTVLVSPDPPTITQGDVLVTTEDRDVEIECVSANGKPAAEITWIDGFGNVLTQNIDYSTELTADRKRFNAKSTLNMKATKESHNKTIICQAQNTVDIEYRTAQIRIEVKYAPKVMVTTVEGALDTGRIPEGNIVTLLCQADANPSDINFRWYLNDEQIDGQSNHVVTIFNVTRDYQNSVVKCVVQNSVGISSDSETLDVIYQPSFIRRPQNLEADDQEPISLHCEVDANPVPEIVWVFDPIDRVNLHPRVVGTATQLDIIASTETAGRYFCKAHSTGFSELRSEATVSLKGPPKIISPNEQFPNSPITLGGLLASSSTSAGSGNARRPTSSVNHDAFEIECVAISIPKAEHVSWAFNGKLIDFDADEGFTLRESYMPDGVKSTLTIEENHVDYFGKYSCIVINSYGSDTLEIFFTEPRKFSPIIAIAGSVLIFIIIISGAALIVFCVRMNKSTTLPPADIIPKESVTSIKGRATNRKHLPAKIEMPTENPNEYQESNSGSYSTTTTLSINKTDLIANGRAVGLSIPVSTRYSGNYNADSLSIQTNQSITGGGSSYVDYARDYYSPTIQNANNSLLQQQMHRETPTYV